MSTDSRFAALHPSHRRRLNKLLASAEEPAAGVLVRERTIPELAAELGEPESSLRRSLSLLVRVGVLKLERQAVVQANGSWVYGKSVYTLHELSGLSASQPGRAIGALRHELSGELSGDSSMRYRPSARESSGCSDLSQTNVCSAVTRECSDLLVESAAKLRQVFSERSGSLDETVVKLSQVFGVPIYPVGEAAIRAALAEDWEGTVRVFESVLQRPGIKNPVGYVIKLLKRGKHRALSEGRKADAYAGQPPQILEDGTVEW